MGLPCKLALAAPIMAVSMMLTPCTALAQASGHLDHNIRLTQGGRTDIAFTAAFVASFNNLGLALTATDSAEIRGARVFFPITAGGVVDVNVAGMQVLHSGALTFSGTNTNTVTVSGLILDVTSLSPTITALLTVNGTFLGRITLFDVTPPTAGLTLPLATTDELLQINLINLSLDSSFASILNNTYQTNTFVAGTAIGQANLNAFLL